MGTSQHADPPDPDPPHPSRAFRWWQEVVAARLRVIRHIPQGGAGLVAALLAANVLLGLLPVAFIVATSTVIGRVPAGVGGGLGSPEADALIRAFLLAAGLFVAQAVLTPVRNLLGELMTRRVDGRLQQRLIDTSLRSTGIGPLEDPVALDALDEVSGYFEGRTNTPGSACAGMLALVARYLQLGGLVVLTGLVGGWWAGLALAVAVGVFRTGQRGGLRIYVRVHDKVNSAQRRTRYLREAAAGPRNAKELRIFGLTGWLTDRYAADYTAVQDEISRVRRKVYLLPYLGYTALGLAVAGFVFAALGRGAARGDISLTDLALGIQATMAALLMGGQWPEADLQTSLGMRAWQAMDVFEAKIADAERRTEPAPAAAPGAAADLAGRPAESLRLQKVAFGYPAAGRPVLDGLDLELPAGLCTAVVGVNGAGKTTLVKLLTRLHEPTEGRITVDGTDLAQVPVELWRRQVSVVFQDFVRYELSAADNIAFGGAHAPPDRAAVRAAAARAGVLEVLERLPKGLDTILSRTYQDGADLSGGQWQRVAIARSLYALDAGARVLVLDEPTSALDVRAEAAFFDSFVELTRGVTSLLISHRFSSVRRADRIVVIDGGRVVEQGVHEELLAAGGHYAKLFTLQAERFAAGLTAEGEIDESRFGEGQA